MKPSILSPSRVSIVSPFAPAVHFEIGFVRIAAVTIPYFPALGVLSMTSITLTVLRFVASLVELYVNLTTPT